MSPDTSREPAVTGWREQDFDLHGIVRIRLVDASPDDVATVERQLGPLQQSLKGEPDITVRFVDSATTRPLTYVGVHESGFNDDGFFLLQGRGGVEARASIPFDQIGRHPEIICERAMPAVPHLLAIINLTALAKGVLPLHASAFTAGTSGVLVTGWSKGGKTESLVACMSQGAKYVGDEWVYLTPAGQMLGVPEPIRLWAWHFDQLPDLLRSRSRRERWRLSAWKRISRMAMTVSRSPLPGTGLVRRASPVLSRQAYLQIPPADLFGPEAVTLRGQLDAVVLVVSHESPETVAQPVAAAEVSGRMAASLADERATFMTHYRHFQYAYPELTNDVVDAAETVESRLLATFLDHRPTAKVLHPHPCDIGLLGRTVLSAASNAVQVQVEGTTNEVRSRASDLGLVTRVTSN